MIQQIRYQFRADMAQIWQSFREERSGHADAATLGTFINWPSVEAAGSRSVILGRDAHVRAKYVAKPTRIGEAGLKRDLFGLQVSRHQELSGSRDPLFEHEATKAPANLFCKQVAEIAPVYVKRLRDLMNGQLWFCEFLSNISNRAAD